MREDGRWKMEDGRWKRPGVGLYWPIGPCPMHDVVVMAVRKAVSAATTTFATISTIRFLFMFFL